MKTKWFTLLLFWVAFASVAGEVSITSGQINSNFTLYAPIGIHNLPASLDPTPIEYQGLALVGLGNETEIYTFRADGSDIQRLTNNEWEERSPTFSPIGDKIAFWQRVSGIGEYPDMAQVMVMDRDGTNLRALDSPRDFFETGQLKWSPNGAFLLAAAGDVGLTLLTVADGNEIVIGQSSPNLWEWSPTGEHFYRAYLGRLWSYQTINPTPILLTDQLRSYPDNGVVLWHPTENEILYVTTVETLVVVSPDGTNPRVLAREEYTLGGWLEAGQKLLLLSQEIKGGTNLYTIPFAGGTISPYGSPPAPHGVDFMDVSPHGDAVIYASHPVTMPMTTNIIYHSLSEVPIHVAECNEENNQRCITSQGFTSWSDDNSAITFSMSYFDGSIYRYKTVYAKLGNVIETVVTPNGVANSTFLPRSARYATGYDDGKYAILYLLDLPEGSQTRLVPELGNFVTVHEWRHVTELH